MREHGKIIYAFVFLALLAGDQYSKYIIRSTGGFYVCNTNLAFGLSITGIIYILLAITLGWLIVSSSKNWKFPPKADQPWAEKIKNFKAPFLFSIILIFTGGLSNIIDRLARGCVIDFINLKFYPVFNLADVYITIGAIILIIRTFKRRDI